MTKPVHISQKLIMCIEIISDSIRKAMDEMDAKHPSWRLQHIGQVASRIQERQQLAAQKLPTDSSYKSQPSEIRDESLSIRGRSNVRHDQCRDNTGHGQTQHRDYQIHSRGERRRSLSSNGVIRGRSLRICDRSQSRSSSRGSFSYGETNSDGDQYETYARLEEGRLGREWNQPTFDMASYDDIGYSTNSTSDGYGFGEIYVDSGHPYDCPYDRYDYDRSFWRDYGR